VQYKYGVQYGRVQYKYSTVGRCLYAVLCIYTILVFILYLYLYNAILVFILYLYSYLYLQYL
jgi:hypothetical protein